MSARLDTLRSLVAQDPTNTRIHYMLCMELVNSGALDDAIPEFIALLTRDPDYGPAYYHGAQTLEKLGRKPEARTLYAQGIEATSRTGDSHTRGELQGALDMLG
jgi:predicted Zn-dependent protease